MNLYTVQNVRKYRAKVKKPVRLKGGERYVISYTSVVFKLGPMCVWEGRNEKELGWGDAVYAEIRL